MMDKMIDYAHVTTQNINKIIQNYMDNCIFMNEQRILIPDNKLTWNNFIKPELDFDNKTAHQMSVLNMAYFHTDEEIRTICFNKETELDKFSIDQNMRKDVYAKFLKYYNTNYQIEKKSYSKERCKYIEKALLEYKMNGLELCEKNYNKVKEINKRLTELSNSFEFNIGNENKHFIFTKEELYGMTEKYLEDRLNSDGLYKISLSYPDYYPLMKYCKTRHVREKINNGFYFIF